MEASSSSSSASGGGGGTEEKGGRFEYFGWVYHLGVNSIGHEYCHLRFLFIRGKCVSMYKRDPHQNPGIVCIFLYLFHSYHFQSLTNKFLFFYSETH